MRSPLAALSASRTTNKELERASERVNGPKNNRKNVNENGVKNQFHGFYIPVYLL